MTGRRPQVLGFREFWETFVRVPVERTRQLVSPPAHAEQRRLLAAVDARDPAGLRVYREFVLSWVKKAGKSTTAAALGLWALVADDLAQDREVIVVASDLGQAQDVIFATAAKLVQRHPWLRKHVTVRATELLYAETVTEPRTGGRYQQTHVLKALPRDVRGLHGSNASCVLFDEVWAQDDYELIESLAPSPARVSPILAYFSYAGLRSQRHAGHPWYDLLQRAREGQDPGLFLSHLGGEDGWRQVPWITSRWVEGMRRQFATIPSKFQRLVLNEWAATESGLLTADEVRAASDAGLVEPLRGAPGVRYALALDLGLSFDWTALVLAHVDPSDQRVVVDLTKTWRGTRTAPVSLTAIEDAVVALSARFPLSRVVVDQWQAALLIERLRARGVPNVQPVTVEPARLDTLTTLLKGLFARRGIRIPSREHDLLEQLESLEVVETGAKNRRRDRLRFTSGAGVGAAAHDDLAVALALACEVVARDVGRAVLPPAFRACWRAESLPQFPATACYLFGGVYFPSGDPCCQGCHGHQAVIHAQRLHAEQTGEISDLREFYAARMLPNAFVQRLKARQWADALL